MIIQAELKCKQTGCEADPCAVDTVTRRTLRPNAMRWLSPRKITSASMIRF